MSKINTIIIIFLVMFLLVTTKIFAADLVLTKIGTFPTAGEDYSIVDWMGSVPVLEGTATPGAQVTVKINTVTAYATAASPSGVWQFIPSALNTGENIVTITAAPKVISFVLNFNTPVVPTATPSARPTTTIVVMPTDVLPETGTWENIVMVIMGGVAVIFLGSFARQRMQKWEGKKG